MGRRNRQAVTTQWARLLADKPRSLTLAYCIADAVPDDKTEWWGRHRVAAEWLGLLAPGGDYGQRERIGVQRAVRVLRVRGFLTPVSRSSPNAPTQYAVHFKEPSIGGETR